MEPPTRACSKCGTVLPLAEFPQKRARGSVFRLSYCRDCHRKQRNASQRKLRKRTGRASDKRWAARNLERMREYQRRANATPRKRAQQREYARSEHGRAKKREYERRQRLVLRAALPVEVVQPYVLSLLREFGPDPTFQGVFFEDERPGYKALANAVGVNESTLRRIADGTYQNGRVSVEIADRLAIYGDFSLAELTARAEEWAQLTGAPWPEEYQPRTRHKRRGTLKHAA